MGADNTGKSSLVWCPCCGCVATADNGHALCRKCERGDHSGHLPERAALDAE